MQNSCCFTIDISIQKDRPYLASGRKSVLRMSRSHWYSLFYPPMMQADPFLFVKGGALYLFYEYLPIGKGLGVIKMTRTKDLKHWSRPIQITHEPECHFSYPWVFEEDGVVYLMPETGCDHNIRLYRAVNDELTDWVLDEVLLERKIEAQTGIKYDFADSSLYKKDDVYYLFTSVYKNEEYSLELYTSQSLKGPYSLHSASPICVGNKYGRCAGSLIEVNGMLYRPAQDCVDSYGGQVHMMEIDELTPNTYREYVARESVLPQEEQFYHEGGHQINFALFQGNTVVATDVRYYTTFFLERVRIKMLKLFGFKEDKPY